MVLPWHNFNFFNNATISAKPRIAISACLNGEAVRYDGTDKLLETTSTMLPKHLTLLPICPEVGAGLSVPRPPVQLVQTDHALEVIGRHDKTLNVTTALHTFRQQCHRHIHHRLCGYIFKSHSPSCGLNSTPIFNSQDEQIGIGSGLQADYFQQQMPWLYLQDESQLQTDRQCQQFIMQCLLSFDLQQGSQDSGLAAIHQHYQFLIDKLTNRSQALLQTCVRNQAQTRYWTLLLKALKE
ncbi:MAG: DUF523 domain-containing protein [Pseudomonadales bacterium]